MAIQKPFPFAQMIWTVTEDKFFKDEIILEFHSFVRIISGEMKVIQADRSYTFSAGSTLLFPRNQLSAVIKQPKDGWPYKAVVLGLTLERLKAFYAKNQPQLKAPAAYKVRIFDNHPLLESFFTSLIPYFDLDQKLPESVASLKVEEAIAILRFIDPGTDNLLADFSEPGKINLAEFMDKHYMFNMPMAKFAYLTGRSLSTFNRDFKISFRITPQKWLMQKRLELAHYQIAENHRRAVDVYRETGFENLSHFSYAFKKHFGYAPTELPGREAL